MLTVLMYSTAQAHRLHEVSGVMSCVHKFSGLQFVCACHTAGITRHPVSNRAVAWTTTLRTIVSPDEAVAIFVLLLAVHVLLRGTPHGLSGTIRALGAPERAEQRS